MRICPYCGRATGFEDVGLPGSVSRTERGGMQISGGAEVVIGRPETGARPCPFCGASVEASSTRCPHCSEKVVIETLRVAQLVITGGSLVVGAGGSVSVIGRRSIAVHEGARAGDVSAIKAAVVDGDDPSHPDENGRTPLHHAATHGHGDALRYLVSLGAELDRTDDDGRTALHHAAEHGHDETVSSLLSVGASSTKKDRNGATAGDLAKQRGHADLAERLGR